MSFGFFKVTVAAMSTTAFLGAAVQASLADEKEIEQKKKQLHQQGHGAHCRTHIEYTPVQQIRHITRVEIEDNEPAIRHGSP